MTYSWPLMDNNILREDLDAVIELLKGDPILTQSAQVQAFEEEWARWLGVKYSVFVNSGASANFISMAIIQHRFGVGEVITPTLAWVSDVSSVLYNNLTPIFVDVDPRTMGMDNLQILDLLTPRTKAVFLTHVQGFNALTGRLLEALAERSIPLIEDACESHGATFHGRKVGTFGLMSNFSFYFAHHMSTIEGGMISTDDEEVYQMARVLRSHGMVREATSAEFRRRYETAHPDLNPQFIFAYPSNNFRSTEINAVIGRNQLKRLDANNRRRYDNFKLFLNNLDTSKYRTDFALEGSVNYAFILILRKPDPIFRDKVMATLDTHGIEYRRGTAGGGNQLRQPYLRHLAPSDISRRFPHVDHIHFYGFYIGNYPTLLKEQIVDLCNLLNHVE